MTLQCPERGSAGCIPEPGRFVVRPGCEELTAGRKSHSKDLIEMTLQRPKRGTGGRIPEPDRFVLDPDARSLPPSENPTLAIAFEGL